MVLLGNQFCGYLVHILESFEVNQELGLHIFLSQELNYLVLAYELLHEDSFFLELVKKSLEAQYVWVKV